MVGSWREISLCVRENKNDTGPGQRATLRLSKLVFLLRWNENKTFEIFPCNTWHFLELQMLKSLPCLKVQRTVLSLTAAEQDSSHMPGKSEGLRVARRSSGRSAARREPFQSLVQVPAVNHHQKDHVCMCWLCRTSAHCLPAKLSNTNT